MSDGNLPPEIVAALSARSEADVKMQPDNDLCDAPARAPAQQSAVNRLVAVLGPDFKRLMAGLLLVGFKIVELTDAEKKQVQEQMIEVAREAKPADLKPNVLKMPARPRIIRPN